MAKDTAIGVRIAAELKAVAAKAAAADRRSVSSLMEKLLVEYLVEEGYLTLDDNEAEASGTPPDKDS